MNEQYIYQADLSDLIGLKPQRVVSLVPSMTESLFDLNMGDRLVAVTDYCEHPADKVAHLPKVGGTKNPNIKQIIALKPDLVIMNQEENRLADAEALSNAGIRIWVTHPRTVAEAINMLWDMVGIFDETSMVPRIQHIDRVYDMMALAAESQPRLKTFVPIWRDPWMTFNRDTYIHDLLYHLGAENVFADRMRQFPLKADLGQAEPLPSDDPRVSERDVRYPRVSLEEIVSAQPELILLPTEPYAFSESDVEIFSALDIPAVHYQNIYVVDGSLLTWHGTRIAQALRELPPILDEARNKIYPTENGVFE
ncbi:MAG: ABC transporter substrate-binding protein [Phototrophicales bacterium]|nr:MAG: ABC transporter substrate-binding protein [Phototrophicales bacterium]